MGKRIFIWMAAFALVCCTPTYVISQNSSKLKLQSALSIAEKNNHHLKSMRHESDAVKAGSWSEWWPDDPKVAVEWEGIPSGSGLDKYEERRITVSQEIELPWNIYWRNRLSAHRSNAADMRFESEKTATRSAAIIAYVRYQAAAGNLQLAEKRMKLAGEFLEKARIRRDAGEAAAIEVVRAQVELARAGNQHRDMESSRIAAQAKLNLLLARKPDQPIFLQDSLVYRRFVPVPESLQANALRSHPLIRESGDRVKAAQQFRKLSWGNILPSIELSGFRQKVTGNSDFYGMEIGVKIPLWFAFRQRNDIREASALLAASESQFDDIKLQLAAEVEQLFARFIAAREKAENYRNALLAPANEVFRIARRSYETGEAGYLQLLEAQQTLVDVRLGYIQSLEEYYTAIAELEAAAGFRILE